MSRRSITAVVFDYYFTLAEPAPTNFVALARSIACQASPEAIEHARQGFLAAQPQVTPVFDGGPTGFRSYHDEWVLAGDAIFDRLGSRGGGAAYAALRAQAHQDAMPYTDSIEVIAALGTSGLGLGVLSDADTGYLEQSITRHEMRFDAVVSSEAIRCYKPHRRGFEQVCSLLGTEPSETLFVGDSPVPDIEGSHRAGLQPIWLNRRHHDWPDDLTAPHREIETLYELGAIIRSRRFQEQWMRRSSSGLPTPSPAR